MDKGQIYFKDLNKYLITRVNGEELVFDIVKALTNDRTIWDDKNKLMNAVFNETKEETDTHNGTWKISGLGDLKRKEIMDHPEEPPYTVHMNITIDKDWIIVNNDGVIEFNNDFYEFIVFFRHLNTYFWSRNQVCW